MKLDSRLTFVFLLVTNLLFGQAIVTIGDVENNDNREVVNGYYNYSKYQYIYTPQEVQYTGEISSLSFFVNDFYLNESSGSIQNVSIYIGSTNQSSFTSGNYSNDASYLVYQGDFDPELGWNVFTFINPYEYSGNGNLIISVESHDGDWLSNPIPEFAFFSTNQNEGIGSYQDSSFPSTGIQQNTKASCQLNFTSTDQTTIQLGNEESSSKNAVINGYYNYSKYQYIYKNTEINYAGKIQSLNFKVNDFYLGESTGVIENVSIYLNHTGQTNYSSSAYNENYGTLVYSGSIDPQLGWNCIPLISPYEFNGINNLLITIVSEDGDWYENPIPKFSINTTNDYLSVGEFSDYYLDGGMVRSKQRPVLKLVLSETTPALNLTSIINNNDCSTTEGGSINLIVNGGNPPYTYSWNNGATSSSIANLNPGKYSVTVTDAKGTSLSESYEVSNLIEWDYLEGINSLTNNGVSKFAVSGTNNSYASSKNSLIGDGEFSYVIEETGKYWIAGFSTQKHSEGSYYAIDYAFELWGNTAWISESGSFPEYANISVGDRITIKREGASIQYYINEVQLNHSSYIPENTPLFFELSIDDQGVKLNNLNIDFCPVFHAEVETTTSSKGFGDGTAIVNIDGGVQPYTVFWNDGEITNTRTNLQSGDYEVFVTDATGETLIIPVIIKSRTSWAALESISYENNQLKKSGSSTEPSGAIGKNILKGNGDLSFEINNANVQSIIGFTSSPGLSGKYGDNNYYDIDFALEVDNGYLYVAEKNSFKSSIPIEAGDVGMIRRTGDLIEYLINGSIFYTSSVMSSGELFIEASIETPGATIDKLEASFSIPDAFDLKSSINNTNVYNPNSGIISVTTEGGQDPFIYEWSTGETTSQIESVQSGKYQLTVTDANNKKVYRTYEVGTEIEYDLFIGFDKQGDVITKTESNSWGNSAITSSNYLKSGEEGYAELVIENLSSEFSFAFNEPEKAGNVKRQPYSLFVKQDLLFVAQYGVKNASTQKSISIGDRIRIELRKGYFLFKLNGKLIAYQPIPSGKDYVVDIVAYNTGASFSNVSGIFTSGELKPNKCQDESQHYIHTISYDEFGNIKEESKQYYNGLGQVTQNQTTISADKNVLASEPIYDQYGRQVGGTLNAPTYKSILCYNNKFFTNNEGEPFSFQDHDIPNYSSSNAAITPGELYNSKRANDQVKGSLGWYYSNNNSEEPYVASNTHPFSRGEFYNDPLNRTRRTSSVGSIHKLGTAQNSQTFYFSSGGELQYVYGKTLYKGDNDEKLNFSLIAGAGNKQHKTVHVDVEGKTFVTYSSSEGSVIATCRSGIGGCASQKTSHIMYYKGEKGIDIHLPASKSNTLKFTLNEDKYVSEGDVIYRIFDLTNDQQLVQGVDYLLSESQEVSFIGNYIEGDKFLRIRFDYTDEYKESFPTYFANGTPLPNQYIEYELDYSNWTLNYYNHKGNLTRTIQPEGVDCNSYDPYLEVSKEETSFGQDVYSASTGYQLNDNYFEIDLTRQIDFEEKIKIVVTPFGKDLSNTMNNNEERCDYYEMPNVNDPDYDNIIKEVRVVNENPISYLNDLQSIIEKTQQVSSELRVENNSGSENHCGNGYQDYDEEGVDCGGSDCGPCNLEENPCQGLPPQFFAGYKLNLQYIGVQDDGTEEILPINDAYVNMDMYVTCDCELIKAGSYFHVSEANIGNPVLSNFDKLIVKVIGAEVRTEYNGEYQDFDLSASRHNFLKYIRLTASSTYIHYPIIRYPNHNHIEDYYYDDVNNLKAVRTPDKGITEYIYDREGNLRFSQNAKQRTENKFLVNSFDRAGRIIQNGEYNPIANFTEDYYFPSEFTSFTGNSSAGRNVAAIVDNKGVINGVILTDQFAMSYDINPIDIPPAYGVPRNGVGKMVKSSNDHSSTWYSYDNFGRLEWSVQLIHSLNDYKKTEYDYNYFGSLTRMSYQANNASESAHYHYVYDKSERLQKVLLSETGNIDDGIEVAEYFYYDHGALKRVEYEEDLQGMDYVYTIQGRLKSINSPSLNDRDPGKDGFSGGHSDFQQDVFGMTLDYYDGDYQRAGTYIQTFGSSALNSTNPETINHYDGKVKAFRWQTKTSLIGGQYTPEYADQQLLYAYKYDNNNQLIEAVFGGVTVEGTLNDGINKPRDYYGPKINTTEDYKVSNITYDLNGNLQSLSRNGVTNLGLVMDNLSYSYNSGTNQLNMLNDAVVLNNYEEDIKQQPNNNYTYNELGEMISDELEGNYLEYNALGLVKTVFKDAGKTIKKVAYLYDDRGKRLQKKSFSLDGSISQIKYYFRNALGQVIETKTIDLSNGEESSIYDVIASGRIGTWKKAFTQIEYELTDYLGNVRAIITRNELTGIEILSQQDYYPWGGVMPGRNYKSTFISENRSYQGQLFDNETNYNSFDLRNFDSRIGRWLSTDPYNQYYSPYMAMGNNPISFTDPTGGFAGSGGTLSDMYMTATISSINGDNTYVPHISSMIDDFEAEYFGSENNFSLPGAFGGHNADGTPIDWEGDVFSRMYKVLLEKKNQVVKINLPQDKGTLTFDKEGKGHIPGVNIGFKKVNYLYKYLAFFNSDNNNTASSKQNLRLNKKEKSTWIDKTVDWIGNNGHQLGVTFAAVLNAYAGVEEIRAGTAMMLAPTGVTQVTGVYFIGDGVARIISAPFQIYGTWTGNTDLENAPHNLLGATGYLIDSGAVGEWTTGGTAQTWMEIGGDFGMSRRKLIDIATKGFTNPKTLMRMKDIGNAGWQIIRPYKDIIQNGN